MLFTDLFKEIRHNHSVTTTAKLLLLRLYPFFYSFLYDSISCSLSLFQIRFLFNYRDPEPPRRRGSLFFPRRGNRCGLVPALSAATEVNVYVRLRGAPGG